VAAKFGVPLNVIDYLTLIGDVVDNVPGVAKVGPKTAVKWLTEYGTLDNLLAHADAIKGVVGDNLRAARDWLPQARVLITIKTDVALPFDFDSLTLQPRDTEALRALFERYELRTWLRELTRCHSQDRPTAPRPREGMESHACHAGTGHPATIASTTKPSRPKPRSTPGSPAEAAPALRSTPKPPASTPCRPNWSGFRSPSATARRLPAAGAPLCRRARAAGPRGHTGQAEAAAGNRNQNHRPALKYDATLANYGIRSAAARHAAAVHVLEAHQSHELGSLASRHLGLATISYDDVTGKGASRIGFEQVAIERASEYAAEDADITLRVRDALAPQIAGSDKLDFVYRQIELPVAEILFRMERAGVLLDRTLLAVQSGELGRKMLELEQRAYQEAGQPFNLGSPADREILFRKKVCR
jgi:DNA polymerase-1